MYATLLLLHSWLRWLVILTGIWAVASAATAHPGRPHRASLFFTVSLDIQFLLGVLLYVVLSPVTRAALTDLPAAMANSGMRFWTVEHPTLMILAVVFAHVGRAAARTRRAMLAWYGLALAAILAATPWPFLSNARPLLRWWW